MTDNPIFADAGVKAIGTLTVEGSGAGNPVLTISDGALTAGGLVELKAGAGASGSILIEGADARLAGGAGLTISSGANSSFTINEGKAEFTGAATISAGKLVVGKLPHGTAAKFTSGALAVNGTGAVEVFGSGFLAVGGDAAFTGATAVLTIGTDAVPTAAQGVAIAGKLDATDGATLTVTSGLLAVTGDVTLDKSTLTLNDASKAQLTVGGKLDITDATGALNVTKSAASTITGAATINAGKLNVGTAGADAASLAVGSLTASNGGDVAVAGSGALLTVNGDASFAGAGTTLALDTGAAPEANKGIAVTGKLDVTGGAAAEVQSGLLAVTGDLTVDGSTLKVGGGAEDGQITAANLVVKGTGSFEINDGSDFTFGTIDLKDTTSKVVSKGTEDTTLDDKVVGAGSVVLEFTDATTKLSGLNAENAHTGGFKITKGTLEVADVAGLGAAGSRVITFDGASASDAGVVFADSITSDEGVTFARADSGRAIKVKAASAGKTFSINQVLGGSGNVLLDANGGTIALTGTNTFVGGVGIAGGTVEISSIDNLGLGDVAGGTPSDPWTRTVQFAAGTTLAIAGTELADDTYLSLVTAANNFAVSVNDAAHTFTLNRELSGAGTLEKKGEGKLVLASAVANGIAGVKVSGGTLAATAANQLGGGAVNLNGGFLNVGKAAGADTGIADGTGLAITLEKHADADKSLQSGFDIDSGKVFTLATNVTAAGAGLGTATLVKKGEGTLELRSAGNGEQVDNILQAGTLSVTTAGQLGDATKKVTFAGGALGIGDGVAAATLHDDAGINLFWGAANADKNATIDVAKESSFTIAANAFGKYDTFDPVTGDPLPAKSTVTGALVKKGEGTLVLSSADIDYTGGTVIEAGTLKVDSADDKFRFKNGKYTVNGGTLEADISDLTITELAGSGKTGAEIPPATPADPAAYELNAGTIVVAQGVNGSGTEKQSKLTLNGTTGETGFWGKIVGFFTEGAVPADDPRVAAGTLEIDAAGKEVVLTGNASEIGTVNVKAGTLRVNNGTLPVSDLLGAPTTTHNGSLTANTVSVNGTEDSRASLAGSGTINAPVSVGQYGSLLGNKAGTLTVNGDVTFADGATIELGGFLAHHNTAGTTTITNQYFHVDGTVTGAGAGTLINLNNDALDPGVYRVISSTAAIVNGDKFAVGSIGDDLPAGSVTVGLSGEDKNLDLFAATGRASLRYWNGTPVDGVSTWTVGGTDWTDQDKSNAGDLQQTVDSNALGVFGYTDFPQQGGTVNVSGANTLTQGLQFFSSSWLLTGDALELKGGAADTDYAGKTTINTGDGNIVINNQLTGSAALRKTGGGTLALWGDNTYAGGTIIEGGTLAVASNAHLGASTGSVTLNGAGSTLALGSGFGSTNRDIVVNLPANTSGSVNLASTIDLGGAPVSEAGAVRFGGALTGNGYLSLNNGGAVFTGQNAVNFGGTVFVTQNAGLAVQQGGSIGGAIVDGTLWGTFGHTLTIDDLVLNSSAQVWLELPSDSNGAVTAFKGTNATLGGQITSLDLPTGYAVGDNGTSLYVFDYVNRSGEITISDSVKSQYADSNFTFGGVVNGYLVLNSKTTPAPQPGAGETVNVDQLRTLATWTETSFVDGQTWNNGVATFNGNGTNKPVNVEGQIRIAGLTINGQNFLFKDAGVSGKPGAFLLQAASGTTVVDFTVAKDGSATIAIPVAGSDFAKKGAGHLVLSANSPDFTGTGTVQEGTLYVTGNFANGSFAVTGGLLRVNGFTKQVTVGPNGTLEGLFSGAANSRGVNIGTLVVNGGTLKPGNSPGTLRVGGLAQTAGVIEFERGDKIEVLAGVGGTPNGRAVFSKAANGTQVDLRLTTDTRSYTYGNTYTFVTAENGVTFTTTDAVKVTEVGNGRLFSSFRAAAEGRNGVFFLQRDRAFGTQAWTGNQLAVAGALESLTPADLRSSRGAIYDAIASASNDEANLVRAAFDQLSGEIHASAKGVLIDESRHLREATVNRTRAALNGSAAAAPGQVVQTPAGSNLALWGQVYGSWGETDSSNKTAKLDRSTGGFVLGFDTGIADNWRLGIAGGYAKSDIKSNSNLSKADVDNYNLAVYGGSQFGSLGLRFGLGHTWHRLDTERQLNVLGLRDINQGKYDARTLQLYAEAGYEVKFDAVTVEPFLNLAYVHHSSDSFVERGLGLGSALTSHSQDESTGFSTLGLRLSKNFDLSGAKGTATGTLGWKHAFGDVDPASVFSANGTSLFAITGAPIAQNALVLGVGLDVEIAHGTTLGVSYNGQVGDHTSDHGVKGNFSVKF